MRLWWNWQTRYLEGVVGFARGGSSPLNRTISHPRAVVAELADALDSGSSGSNTVEVQVLSTAPYATKPALPSGRAF